MKFNYHIVMDASKEALWAMLEDFQRVSACMPGVERMEQVSEDAYEGVMRVRIGPMGINFNGAVTLDRDEASGTWKMTAQAQDRKVGGGARAVIAAVVGEEAPGRAAMDIAADVQLMGRLGELGQPLIKRKADTMLQEFAANLQREVGSRGPRAKRAESEGTP